MEANRTSFNGDINAKGVPLSHRISKLSGLKWATVLIPLAYIVLTLVVSGFGIIKKSFTGADGFTLDYYVKIFTEPLYLKVLLNTLLGGSSSESASSGTDLTGSLLGAILGGGSGSSSGNGTGLVGALLGGDDGKDEKEDKKDAAAELIGGILGNLLK